MAKPHKKIPGIAWLAPLLLAGLLSGILIFIKISPSVSLQDFTGIFKPQQKSAVASPSSSLQLVPFETQVIDSQISGDIKLVGDIDGDGYPDLVMGGIVNEKLNWYRYPNWEKSVIAVPTVEFTTDGALGDVNGDSYLDIVVPDGDGQNNLVWFQNPMPGKDPGSNLAWSRQTIGTIGSWGKDIELADFDGDGRLDVATRSHDALMIFFQTAAGQWERVDLSSPALGSEGMTSGDIDRDGAIDLVLQGNWLRDPGGMAARQGKNWLAYTIGEAPANLKALVTDINQDGVSDVLFSSSEDTADVNWWTPENGDPTGPWIKHTILPNMEKTHTLQAADIDLDGHMDVVLAQMHTSAANEIMVLYNQDGAGLNWVRQVIATGGIHNGVVADIGNDGDYDIFGANWTGNPPVRLFINHLDGRVGTDHWTYIQVSNQHSQTFGLTFGDVNQDKALDILSGGFWYRNPGGDMLSPWQQFRLPDGMHAILSVDVDGDEHPDIIAQKDEGEIALYWLENSDPQANTWETTRIGSVEQASHNLGAQGYRLAQVVAGGRPEILIASGNGIYYFQIPDRPAAGNWPRVHINSHPSDEGFAAGDIDSDGQIDIAGTTGDSKGVEWYRNPGDRSAEWTAYPLGDFSEAVYPDRTEMADLNGDGRLDVIVTEENGQDSGAHTVWWEAPPDPARGAWSKHTLTTQGTTNSLDVADIDQDGDTDLILGEHRGSKKLAIWENDGLGNFSEKVIATGYESHLGGRTVDLDGDGDLDIVSIAWDDSNLIHLFRNDRRSNPAATPQAVTVTKEPSAQPSATPQNSPLLETTHPLVLYTFQEGSGPLIQDTAGYGEPLNLKVQDEAAVVWMDAGGLQVTRPTILIAEQPATKILAACQQSGEISLEAWIKPADLLQNGPARILSLSFDPFNRNFTLGQEGSSYEVRLRTSTTSENGIPASLSPAGALNAALTQVIYTRSQRGEIRLYIDGTLVTSAETPGDFSNWDPGYLLMLANEFSNDRPWLGEYHRVAIYDQALSPEEIKLRFAAGPSGIMPAAPQETTAPEPSPTTQASPTVTAPPPTQQVTETQNPPGAEPAPGQSTSPGAVTLVIMGVVIGLVVVLANAWFLRRKSRD